MILVFGETEGGVSIMGLQLWPTRREGEIMGQRQVKVSQGHVFNQGGVCFPTYIIVKANPLLSERPWNSSRNPCKLQLQKSWF